MSLKPTVLSGAALARKLDLPYARYSTLLHDGVIVPDERGPRFLFTLAAQHKVQVRHLRPSVPTLEDVFAKAVGEN